MAKCSSILILLGLNENPVMCCGKTFEGQKHWALGERVERGMDENFLISFRRVSSVFNLFCELEVC